VLGRRSPGDPASSENASEPAAVPGKPVATGKGRPTPKRSVAEKRRSPLAAPTSRRDAARRSREQRATQRNDSRKALVSGDERALPARDRGPLRRYVRDWADGQRTLSEFMLPFIVIFWIPSLVTSGKTRTTFSFLLSAVVLVLLLELVLKVTFLRRAVKREFPAGGPGRKGAIAYGAMRMASIRMFRLPKPAVTRGQDPRPIR
jgi:Protein of unknown function (DUF3043)